MKAVNTISKFYLRRKDLRNNSTPQEILLWSRIKNYKLGFKFRRQHSIGGYVADFYCTSEKLIIEIDGSQHFNNDGVEYDNNRTKFFEGLGIRVLRFTNTEINNNMSGVLLKIEKELITPSP